MNDIPFTIGKPKCFDCGRDDLDKIGRAEMTIVPTEILSIERDGTEVTDPAELARHPLGPQTVNLCPDCLRKRLGF
jgi:hypothetical protein